MRIWCSVALLALVSFGCVTGPRSNVEFIAAMPDATESVLLVRLGQQRAEGAVHHEAVARIGEDFSDDSLESRLGASLFKASPTVLAVGGSAFTANPGERASRFRMKMIWETEQPLAELKQILETEGAAVKWLDIDGCRIYTGDSKTR